MTPAALDHIRKHRRTLGSQWAAHAAEIPRGSPFWQDAQRLDRHTLAGMDAVLEAGTTGAAEPFAEFAGRLSQEAFALQVPLDEVIRMLLGIKLVVLDSLGETPDHRGVDMDTAQFLNRLISIGVIEAIRRHERQRDRRQLALQEQIDDLRGRLRHQVLVDPLTGLFNANSFALAVRRELQRSRRFGRAFTIGLITLDQDDEIRDALGEEGLRAVILQLADILTRLTRHVDFRAAFGGGRFGMILPETTLEGGFVLAERLRQSVEAATFAPPDHPLPLTHTVSIGLASYPRDGDDDQSLLVRAEEALSRARTGRNTVVAAASAQDL
jgi:diguanylate cyclase (GGDEF)-like protein